ncbi:MAG: oxidoreductase, partial [Pseudomonadota bacterium]
TPDEIRALPDMFARTARLAREAGFGGVQVHAAHGFLLSQFLSPLFNRRGDAYGGSIENRMRLVHEVIEAVRGAVGPDFAVGVKMNATDQLEGGLAERDGLAVVSALEGTSVDLIDISGGTYFPGARSASDAASAGPYFLDFVAEARGRTTKPLMLTGGFKRAEQVAEALGRGVDVVGLARALVLEPALPNAWAADPARDPVFPRFANPPEGGVTAWYTMRLTALGEGREPLGPEALGEAVEAYESRDRARIAAWNARFGVPA